MLLDARCKRFHLLPSCLLVAAGFKPAWRVHQVQRPPPALSQLSPPCDNRAGLSATTPRNRTQTPKLVVMQTVRKIHPYILHSSKPKQEKLPVVAEPRQGASARLRPNAKLRTAAAGRSARHCWEVRGGATTATDWLPRVAEKRKRELPAFGAHWSVKL